MGATIEPEAMRKTVTIIYRIRFFRVVKIRRKENHAVRSTA